MKEQDRGLELKVGLFVAVGLAILAALVVQFGRLGEGFKTYYDLTVHFTDASGLLKGSDVLLGGAKIGRVGSAPRLVRNGPGVDVALRLYDYAHIPVESKFTIGSSGLLGDRFVQVTPPNGPPKAYLGHGARIEGARETGFEDLTKEGNALVKDLRKTVAKIDTTMTKLNDEALSKENMDHLKATFDNLSKTTASLAGSSQKFEGVVTKADNTMGSAKEAADKLQGTLDDARKTIEAAGRVIREANSGTGLLAMLLNDRTVADNLRALIYNLRSHGVLFYRDSAAKAMPPQPESTPGRGRRGR